MNRDQENLSFLDILTIFSVVLQTAGYQQDQRQASNDDLLKALQRQDREYLDKIIETQEEILQILSDIKSDFATKG